MHKKKSLISILLLISLFTVSCGITEDKKAVGGVQSSINAMGNISKIKVIKDSANIRLGCSDTAPILSNQKKDKTLDVISEVDDWFAVKLPNNEIGFVPKDECKPILGEDKKTPAPPTTEAAPEKDQGGKTPDTNTDAPSLTTEEKEMLKLVNETRVQNNVAPLKIDMSLSNVARIKSQDMIDNNYFSHNSPKYGNPFDMMNSFGINYVQAGENIAGNQNVKNAHNSLMNSPGHRKNILNPNFTHIGLGIKKGGPYGYMFTQMFISKPR